MPEAHYFQATIYEFQKEAREAVIEEFNSTYADTSGRCFYDVKRDMFCLDSPTDTGALAVELLENIIQGRLEKLATAEADERSLHVQRFASSSFFDMDITKDSSDVALSRLNRAMTRRGHAETPPFPVFHLVATGGTKDIPMEFFKLEELPNCLHERVLAPAVTPEHAGSVLQTGLVCRVVRWSNAQNDYVFNGRVGEEIDATGLGFEDIISATNFTAINPRSTTDEEADTSPPPETADCFEPDSADTNDPAGSTESLDLSEAAPAIQQYLEGIADVRLATPDAGPAPTAEAISFLLQRDIRIPTRARIPRLPQPQASASSSGARNEDDVFGEDDDKSDGTAVPSGSLALVLRQRNDQEDDLLDDESEANKSDDEAEIKGVSFQSLLGKPPQKQEDTARASTPTPASPLPQTPGNAFQSSPTASHSRVGRVQHDVFAADSRAAQVDRFGLMAGPAHQATLENQLPRAQIITAGSSAFARGIDPADVDHTWWRRAAMPMDTASEIERVNEITNIVRNGPAAASGNMKHWSNRRAEVHVPTGRLIDDSVPAEPVSDGLTPNADLQELVEAVGCAAAESAVAARDAAELGTAHHAASEDSVVAGVDYAAPAAATAGTDDGGAYGDIVERKRPSDDDRDLRQYTMGQKAPRRGRGGFRGGRTGQVNRPQVELPMPDPPPLPKKSNESSANPAQSSGPSNSRAESEVPIQTHGVDDDDEDGVAQEAPGEIAKLLGKVLPTNDSEHAELDVQFGFILLTATKDHNKFHEIYGHSDGFIDALGEAGAFLRTEFFPRLTILEVEARYMLGLVKGSDLRGTVEYEFHIRNCEGNLGLIKLEQARPKDFVVLKGDGMMAKAYVHYPMHLWDALICLSKPQIDSDPTVTKAASEFVSSLTTLEHPPCIEARVPPIGFTVEKVLVKRCFTKTRRDHVTLNVTEVQELIMGSQVATPGLNFHAWAAPQELMVPQQRYWWECALHVDSTKPSVAAAVQKIMDGMIANMDRVGHCNHGPYVNPEEEAPPSPIEEPDESSIWW